METSKIEEIYFFRLTIEFFSGNYIELNITRFNENFEAKLSIQLEYYLGWVV